MKRILSQRGFTLIEVLIGFAIMVLVAAVVYTAQSTSIVNSESAENIIIASNLARNFIEQEEIKESNFSNDDIEEKGVFEKPYDNFHWEKEITKIDFSSLSDILAAVSREASKIDSISSAQQTVFSSFANYLRDSIRKMNITVTWGIDEQERQRNQINITTYLVRYDAELNTNP